ncbi:MAG: UDP-N-acetylmuramoyl-L-alanyl-D-glutamate--2,6-diaminopimelate ligase, partial [Planctomycetota bacterium]
DLHRMLDEMESCGLTHACMEVSSHSLSLHKIDHVDLDVAILTDVTEDHLDFHGSRENYIRAKQRLFEALPEEGTAVLNADSDVCERFQQATDANVLTYGMETLADIRGRILEQTPQGTTLAFRTPFSGRVLETPLIGEYNCQNLLAAATAAFAMGCEADDVAGALKNFQGVPGRLEKINAGSPKMPGVCVDYAHTPDALDKVLTALRPLVKDRLVCVFGCGGDREKEKRPAMGRIATEKADYSVITSDNSRSEDVNDIIDDILEGVSAPSGQWRVEPDRRAAIRRGVSAAQSPESMVVVCGKGAESVLDQGDRKIPFDDREVAAEVLEAMSRREKRA